MSSALSEWEKQNLGAVLRMKTQAQVIETQERQIDELQKKLKTREIEYAVLESVIEKVCRHPPELRSTYTKSDGFEAKCHICEATFPVSADD